MTLDERRSHLRVQELVFDVARALTRDLIQQRGSEVPAQVLFPQLAQIVERYVREDVVVAPPADLRDLHFAPYYGWLVEVLKGYDPLKELKQAAAQRWCSAVNALGGFGHWSYELAEKPERVRGILDANPWAA